MFRHIFPNILPHVLVNLFYFFAVALVSLSALSFLGIGVSPGASDWGRMLAENRTILFQNAAAALAPGLMVVITAASVNVAGDWLFERLSDRGRGR
jgi:peptide/nickel transport system permease protein